MPACYCATSTSLENNELLYKNIRNLFSTSRSFPIEQEWMNLKSISQMKDFFSNFPGNSKANNHFLCNSPLKFEIFNNEKSVKPSNGPHLFTRCSCRCNKLLSGDYITQQQPIDASAEHSLNAKGINTYSLKNCFQRSGFIGSYEESLFSGHMPYCSSVPFEFSIEIGVISFCRCKPSLVFPPHLKINFVAYSLVGNVDNVQFPYIGRFRLRSQKSDKVMNKGYPFGYRIPSVGQLQLILRQTNGLVIKVFLVPYNVSSMVDCSKTWIRQKHYLQQLDDKSGKILSHLKFGLQLQIICTSAGHHYLYDSQRIIFVQQSLGGLYGNTKIVNETLLSESCR
ncbi:DUF4210 domain protein, human FAM214A ortholog, implicated in chromosome segregation [Schizosaccharomyces pombe]|uniref:Uncharacterized protein C3H8.04 n=1 Tax=Schizosaccharomyces pombe (strain 972 / ATCC 24843) TaxID=284812 RepID=YAS4_SCHPO|nr:putative chromosome segregation protein [Schizosaccharomyces pombe]Q10140.1 RecName: Full=Uncharacterized protein C3H8.04 [Schizosaccharomyces pombe 972h-]CAA93161.1 chromosome segregation protein (predicted) [Schizosaccharomyces pombe]|eukprot:NP_592997.1 putative chromosome segregation protein [Schizosaccharomyces pombe]